jgi:hypothetical protein
MNRVREHSKTELLQGLLFGFLVPFVSYAVLLLLNEKISGFLFSGNRSDQLILDNRTVGILAVCFNLIPFHRFDRNRKTKAMRGILLSTFILIILWLYIYGKEAMTLS